MVRPRRPPEQRASASGRHAAAATPGTAPCGAGDRGGTGIRARSARRDGDRMRRVIGRWFAKASGLALGGCFGAASLVGQALPQTTPSGPPSGGIVGSTETSLGVPTPWGLGLQAAGGPVKESIHEFNTLVLW